MAAPPGVVFLDCDGVLVSSRGLLCDFEEDEKTLVYRPGYPPVEKRCLAALQRILRETHAVVVLTTSWRTVPDLRAFLVEVLEAEGCRVIGDTPDLPCCSRGQEVAEWLSEHPEVTHFLALDDDDKHVASFRKCLPAGTWLQTALQHEKGHLFEGITEELADRAISILRADEAQALNKRSKLDAETGRFNRFPGLTVVCDLPEGCKARLSELAALFATQELLRACFVPLPPSSYHVTALDVHCQFKLGLGDAAYAALLGKAKWARAAEDVVALAFEPRLRPKPNGVVVTDVVIGVDLEPADAETPEHPKHSVLARKLVSDLDVAPPRHPWHLTLAYCRRPDAFAAAGAGAREAARRELEAAVARAWPASAGPLPLQAARLCTFQDMTRFTPWC